MMDRRVHAENRQWEIVRYDRAGKWYVEWVGDGPPPSWVGPAHLNIAVNGAGRAPVTVRQAAVAAVGLSAHHWPGRPGGGSFDRAVAARLAAT